MAPLFWIDSLCINQEDKREVETQVQLMGTIYDNAQRVLAWLGEEHEDDCRAIEMIEGMRKYLGDEKSAGPKLGPTMMLVGGDAELPQEGWIHVSALLQRPYFTRLWVIQELVNARDALVLYGKRSVQWEDLGRIVVFISKLHESVAYSRVQEAYKD